MISYKDTATFIQAANTGYQGVKTIAVQSSVPCLFLQNSGLQKGSYEESEKSDAICYPDPGVSFISSRLNSLDGLYVVFNSQWYRVLSYSINRDHLLTNSIDNIEIRLERTTAIAQIS